MSNVKVYGQFVGFKGYMFRPKAYLQWGTSSESLGAFLLLNPGTARPLENSKLRIESGDFCETVMDRTMQQMQRFVESIYGEHELNGRVHIYNLFSLRNPANLDAISTFENLASVDEFSFLTDYPSIDELKNHPWVCKCWGINSKANRKHLKESKLRWNNLLLKADIPTFGKIHSNKFDYYHIRPQLLKDQEVLLNELVELYKKEVTA